MLCSPCIHLSQVEYESSIILYEILEGSANRLYDSEYYKELKRQLQSLKYSTNVLRNSGDFHDAINQLLTDIMRLEEDHNSGLTKSIIESHRETLQKDILEIQILVESIKKDDVKKTKSSQQTI